MIEWDDSLLLGLAKLDEEHKQILHRINTFIEAVDAPTGRHANQLQVHDAYRALERCIYQHLDHEERLLEAANFKGLAQHKASHEKLVSDLEDIWDRMLEDFEFQPDDAARQWLETWLFKHVRNEDFLFKDTLESAALGN